MPAVQTPRHNLPPQPNAFIGRDVEVRDVIALVRRPEVRLVTLLGPGGTGKTRLSLRAGEMLLDDFADGVWFIELAAISDPDLVVPAIAHTLGVRESDSMPAEETLIAALRDRRILLIFDNLEQVVAAAPHIVAVLQAAPHVKILASSRQALHAAGERVYAVPPLPLPDPVALPPLSELARNPAVAIFLQRARLVTPNFRLNAENAAAIVAICVRLDGLPLAIELAASRLRQFPPDAMLAALDHSLDVLTHGGRDRSERQQTLRGLIEWSYSLLSVGEQMLLGRLAVFAGGCTLAAAEAVCVLEDDLPIPVAEGLAGLVDKSMLRRVENGGDTRYVLLQTIHDYAHVVLERFAPEGEEGAIRQQHAAYYASLSEAAKPHLVGAEQGVWLDRLERDHDNLRGALSWALRMGDTAVGLRLVSALWRFWFVRGYLREGQHWAEAVLQLPYSASDQQQHLLRASVMRNVGMLAHVQGKSAHATAILTEALTLLRALGDSRELALTLHGLGIVAEAGDDLDQATLLYGEALALYRHLDDTPGVLAMLNNLGILAYLRDDDVQAIVYLCEALAELRDSNNMGGVAACLNNLAWVALHRHDIDQAAPYLREALTLSHALGDKSILAEALEAWGCLAAQSRQDERAVRVWAAAEALREEIGAAMWAGERRVYDPAVASVKARMSATDWALAWADGQAMTTDAAVAFAVQGV